MHPTRRASSHRVQATDPATNTNLVSAVMETRKHSTGLRASKRAVDIVGSFIFFIFFGWLFVVIWVSVLVTSRGSAIYSQPRYGKDGKIFEFYKFRSMVPNADKVLEDHLKNDAVARQQWTDFQKLEKDPRITKFGAFMRRTSLDELPQFWNVLIGDMSLVGPRPCMLSQKDLYGTNWSTYCLVRPGITGLWQVSGRNELTYQHRVILDVKYIESLSLGSDAAIALRTFLVVATGHGSR